MSIAAAARARPRPAAPQRRARSWRPPAATLTRGSILDGVFVMPARRPATRQRPGAGSRSGGAAASLGETCHGAAAAAAARSLLALVAHATISHATSHLCPSRCLPCHDWWPDRRASSLCHAFAVPDPAPSPRALAWVNGWLLLLLLLLLLGCRAASDSISATVPQHVST